MKKIPTLFPRDPSNHLVVYAAELVDVTGAVATRKFDGTSCLFRGGKLYKRHELRPGKTPPLGYEEVDRDEVTGKGFGWVPVGDGPKDKWHRAAELPVVDGTYELIGPKVRGNPEVVGRHILVLHGSEVLCGVSSLFRNLESYLKCNVIEGVVWWRGEEPIAKIKRKDFGLAWPVRP